MIRRGYRWRPISNLRNGRTPSANVRIRFLRNNGLSDCHYDFSAGRGMVFTTEAGKECVRIHRYFEKTDDPRGLVSVEHDLSSERYWDAIRKASSIDPW